MAKNKDRIIVFDTTLRDGEQAPGCSMTTEEKLRVTRQLDRLRVDVIEAGFPIASPGDFEAVREVAKTVRRPVVAALARCVDADIDRAGEALAEATRGRLHVFLATSEIHRKYKLKKARSEIVKLSVAGIKRALGYSSDVEFSPEDASRTEPDFLCEVVEAAIDAGATTINIPDTVGYAVPEQFGALIEMLKDKVSNIARAVISVHCHNDLGLAVANSIAAVKAGARQVECTVNGIGERAGNCSLEELVMALRTRKDFFDVETGINTGEIMNSSRLVSSVTGMLVQRNKAIVGENAFAHEAGIHQDGVLKKRATYEIMRPEDVGLERTQLVLGKHSGRHAFRNRLLELGIELDEEHLAKVFQKFKLLSDKKKNIYTEDIEALVRDELEEIPEVYKLISFHTTSGSGVIPTATVRVEVAGKGTVTDAATGDGPIDAIYRAFDRICGVSCTLIDYSIHAITGGKDAMGEVSLEVECEGLKQRGRATSTDIIEASARSYLSALNRLVARMQNRADSKERPRAT